MQLNDIMRDLAMRDQGEITAKDTRNTGPAALLADETLAQLVCVFPSLGLQAFSPEQLARQVPEGTPPYRLMRWAFAQIEPDPMPIWTELAGLPDTPHVRRAMYLAIDNRLCHPNGNISTWAAAYVRGTLTNIIENAGMRRRAP